MESKILLAGAAAIIALALLYAFVFAPKASPEDQLPETIKDEFGELQNFGEVYPDDQNLDLSEEGILNDPSERYVPEFDPAKETPESCAKVGDEFKRDICFYYLAIYTGDVSLCDDTREKWNTCTERVAIATGNISYCESLDANFCESGCQRDYCILEVAGANNLPNACEQAGYQRDDCYLLVAMNYNNQALCAKAGELAGLCNDYFLPEPTGEEEYI